MNFKGTKCDWGYAFNELFPNWDEKDVLEIAEQKEIDAFIKGYDKSAKDSKAPEMLERLYQQNIDLKIMAANVKQLEGSVWVLEGMSELIQKWITENETLIKQATEL